MSVRINTNIEALNAQRNLSTTASTFAKSVEKLSSGLRINRAADDAAGLAISQKLQAQVTGLNQAQRNAQDGVSMVQTAEGALNEVHSMLQRIRELAVEASNSTLSSTDAASVSTEITALRAEINRIAGATQFNGQNILTNSLTVSQNTAAAGSLAVGTALNTGHAATVASVDVSGAKASTAYTITSAAGGVVTLTDATGNSQAVTLAGTIGASGSETINFGNLGVRITVVGSSLKTGTELATDLAANSAGSAGTVGGVSATNLVNGDLLQGLSTAAGASYDAVAGLDGSAPLTAVMSAGCSGTYTLHVDGSGNITTTGGVGGSYNGSLAAISNGATSRVTLDNGAGKYMTLEYKQGSAAGLAGEVASMNGATLTNSTSWGSAGPIAISTALPGTYTFTSAAPGTLTLSGTSGSQTINVNDLGSGATETLDFNTLGVKLDVWASASGPFAKGTIIDNLLQPDNNTIIVTGSGTPAAQNNTIATGAGAGANFQVGANAADYMTVNFADARMSATGYGTLSTDIDTFNTATTTGGGTGVVAAAQALITSTDKAIGYVSTTRGNLGAVQNRLEHTTASISVASENLNASMSRIKDLDVASEMVNFTKTQILQQAGTAILAQANSAPQNILSLLR